MTAGLAVPNRADVAFAALAELDAAHFRVALAGLLGTGVVSGCELTCVGNSMQIDIAAGLIQIGTNHVEVAAGAVTVTTAHATQARIDLIYVDTSGNRNILAGTPNPAPVCPAIPIDTCVLGYVYVPAGDTTIQTNQLQDMRVFIPLSPTFDGDQIQRATLGELAIFGHSYAAGVGASDSQGTLMGTAGAERGALARLCATFGMRARSFAVGGSILARHNQLSTGDGGYHHVVQAETRTVRAGTTLAAQANAGVQTITVTSPTGFQIGQAIHVGTGTLGASGGERRYVAAVAGSVLTLDKVLDRTHLNGEPVYEVAGGAFLAWRSVYVLWWGLHDLGWMPISSVLPKYRSRYDDALEFAIAKCLIAEFYDNPNSSNGSVVYSGSFALDATLGCFAGSNAAVFNAAGAKVTIHVMDNFTGEPIDLFFVCTANAPATAEPVLTFRVDGASIGTKVVYQNYQGAAWRRPFVKRITGLAAGRHVIEAELTTYDASLIVMFDGWGVEATEPPLVLIGGFTRMLDDYSYYNGINSDNQPRTTTLTGTHGIGTTSWTVGSTTNWQVGTTVTLEPGQANEESLEVLTIPSATTFTTAASTLSHAGGVTVRSGIQDYDVALMNTRQQAIVDLFGETVVWVDVDATLARDERYFGYDRDHPNDLGYQTLAPVFYDAAMSSPAVKPTLAMTTSLPATPNEIEYQLAGGSTWTNMPAGDTEFQSLTSRRKARTLRRFHQAKFEIGVATVGTAGAIVYPKYSIDGGTTWKKLDRTAQGAEGTGHHLSLAALGPLESSWLNLPEEARTANVKLSLWGSGGDGALDPAIFFANLVFR